MVVGTGDRRKYVMMVMIVVHCGLSRKTTPSSLHKSHHKCGGLADSPFMGAPP